jgi:hypothetical protein
MNARARPLLLLALGLYLAACAPVPAPAARLKLAISAEGLYRVTAAQLQSAGAPLDTLDPATLQLFRGDHEVALRVQGQGADLTFDFYGQASDSPYSADQVYWLRWGAQTGKRMGELTAPRETGARLDSFQDTLALARPTLYIPQASPGESPWFWQALTAPATTTFTLTLPAAIPAPAALRVLLWGNSEDAATNPDHHLRVFFNDARVADETWDGQGAHTLDARVTVRNGNNIVRLVAPGDTLAAADVVLLRSAQVTYARQFIAQNDALVFQAGRGTFHVEGFTNDALDVFDITDPDEPRHVANAAMAARAVTFSSDADLPRRYLAIAAPALQSVTRLAPMTTTGARADNADYVVITHPDFVDALQPLVRWRAQHGLKPVVVTTNEIYDEFGYGAESPLALRAFLDSLQPPPRWVLLVGKASYDFRDYQNGPNKNLLPTFLVDTPHLHQAGSDNWFAAASAADARPHLAIGRIPAKTKDQVTRVVNKIIAFETAPRGDAWRNRAVFIADDKEGSFAEMADILAEKLPAPIESHKIYLAANQGDVDVTRAQLVSRWNAGAGWFTYIGHGSLDTWAEGPLFGAEYLDEIKNGARLPILFTPTCLDGYFYHPQKDSLTETLLFKEDGGIIAGIAPTGLSMPTDQRALMLALYDELFVRHTPTLGEALSYAKQRLDVTSPDQLEVVETFGLLGDPALEY